MLARRVEEIVPLSREEVSSALKQLTGKIWIIVVILYGAGLRIQDCLALRVTDIDFDRHQIVVRRGKGQKDVRTMLPLAIRNRLQVHLEEVKRQIYLHVLNRGRWEFAAQSIGCDKRPVSRFRPRSSRDIHTGRCRRCRQQPRTFNS